MFYWSKYDILLIQRCFQNKRFTILPVTITSHFLLKTFVCIWNSLLLQIWFCKHVYFEFVYLLFLFSFSIHLFNPQTWQWHDIWIYPLLVTLPSALPFVRSSPFPYALSPPLVAYGPLPPFARDSAFLLPSAHSKSIRIHVKPFKKTYSFLLLCLSVNAFQPQHFTSFESVNLPKDRENFFYSCHCFIDSVTFTVA